jgi:hypothetical protein
VQDSKGKDAAIAKWEAEVKKSLAAKKATAAVSLTKQEQAMVQSQLEKEAPIRQHVATVKARLDRGLRLVRSIVAAGVPELSLYVSFIISLLLEGALGPNGSVLVGSDAFDTYLVGTVLRS